MVTRPILVFCERFTAISDRMQQSLLREAKRGSLPRSYHGGKEGPLTPRWNREWDSGVFGAFSPSFAIAKISDMHHIIGAIIDKR